MREDFEKKPQETAEKSEKEHGELIKTANNGVDATKKLLEKYGDLTSVETRDGTVYPVNILEGVDYKIKKNN
jgi:hypothetical protein